MRATRNGSAANRAGSGGTATKATRLAAPQEMRLKLGTWTSAAGRDKEAEWELSHDPNARRFESRERRADGSLGPACYIEYSELGWGVIDMFETFVPEELRGRGVAEELARASLNACRKLGLRVVPSCSYLNERFLSRHPALASLCVGHGRDSPSAEPHPVPRISGPVASSAVPWDRSLGAPQADHVNLMLFLLPTKFCDADHPAVQALAQKIIPRQCTIAEAASRVRNWVREHVIYVLDTKDRRASETLSRGEGMCTNKANLQVALLRAAGIPAGYVIVHISKTAFKSDTMLPAMYDTIADPTVHCFCAVYDPAHARFLHFDATERLKNHPSGNLYLTECFVTGETRYKDEFLVGPFTPPQANIDHLLDFKFPAKIDTDLRDQQNALFRKHNL